MRIALVLLGVAVALALPFFVYPILLMTILCFVIFASSFNLLLGYVGLLCFGQAMFLGLSAYIAGYLLKTTGVSIEIAILASALVSALLGGFVGFVAVRRTGIQFAMITFAFAQFVYFMLLQSDFTGGEDGMQGIPRSDLFGLVDISDSRTFYYFVLAMTALAIFAIYRVIHSPFGEILKAIRDNEARAESLGFRPERFKIIAMMISAGIAGFAGALKATVFQFATLTDVSWTVSGEVILMTLLGGMGTFTGPMVGAAAIIFLNDELAQFGEWALIAQGVILILVILFLRRGVVGEAGALWRRMRNRNKG
tara:strand:+ start:2106 stop:3035 length:930 start_codon:yes stop_codon:yes gene_type:complete